MTDQEIIQAIAEACPQVATMNEEGSWIWKGFPWKYFDPLNDLNATAQMEKINGFHDLEYERLLTWVCDHDWQHATTKTHRKPIYATARQRAEAFLRTIGKWKEL